MPSTGEIPLTALAIRVTNVCSPSLMRIYHLENYTDKLNDISNQLQLQMRRRKKEEPSQMIEPRIGDVVIMHNRLETELEWPAWWIRGVLGPMNLKTEQFNVFLVDHGYTVEARREDFTIIPKSLIPNEYLTSSVGIYNLIPALIEAKKSNSGANMEVGNNWSELAVQLTRNLVSACSNIYFDYLSVDEAGNNYGELYFVLDEEVYSLSEILVCYGQAIYLSEDFTELVNGKSRNMENTRKAVENGLLVELDTQIIDPPKNHRDPNDNDENEKSSVPRNCVSGFRRDNKLKYVGEECQQILVHSKFRCKRLADIEDTEFPARIHKALEKLEMIALRRIQSYMWPAISKGLNVLAIGPPQCGKTLGYIVPVVGSIASRKTLPEGNTPAALILCSSTSDVLNVNALCNELLEVYTDIRCVAGWNGRPDRSLVADIYNGCQILVATPAFLVRFINQDSAHRKLINLEKLSYLVIDGTDVILEKYYESLKQLFRKHVRIGTKEGLSFDEEPIQIIGVARHWLPLVESFAKECMVDPYICIDSYMEAAIFARVKPQLSLVQSNKKMETIADLLGDQDSMTKTMIICANSDEAHAINDFFSKTKKTLMVCEKMCFAEISCVREYWKASVAALYPLLICTDEVLVNLNVTDVDWLIHYSVTLPSKTQFYFRFSTLMDNFKRGGKKCRVTIIADETNDVQLYGLVMAVKNCGTKISSKFMDDVMRIVASLDRKKKAHPICDGIKAFGSCPKQNSCPYRHCVLAGVDTPMTPIKIGDKVKLHVTYVHNATHFTARIMEYISPEKKITKFSAEEYTVIAASVQTYFADHRNRRCHRNVQVGDICAVEESLDNFQRVKVLNIVLKDYDGVPISAELKCIDTGAILPKISVTRLLEIPKDLANRDTHIVEVFLAGLVPYDDEYEWNSRAIDDALNWFPKKSQQNSFVLGTVRLHLSDTLWVDPMEIHTPIIGHPDLVNSSLKRHMLKLKHGQSNKEHLPKLYELCRIGGVRNSVGEEIASTIIDSAAGNETDSVSS